MARVKQPINPQRKQALIEAAGSEFMIHGFERASLNRILEQTDFSKSSFYHYFFDKAALFDAVLEAGAAELAGVLPVPELANVGGEEFWERLRDFDARIQIVASSRGSALVTGRLIHLSDAPRTPSLVAFERRLLRELDRALQAGRRNGAIDTTMPLALQRRLLIAVVIEADKWVLMKGLSSTATDDAFRAIHRLLAV